MNENADFRCLSHDLPQGYGSILSRGKSSQVTSLGRAGLRILSCSAL